MLKATCVKGVTGVIFQGSLSISRYVISNLGYIFDMLCCAPDLVYQYVPYLGSMAFIFESLPICYVTDVLLLDPAIIGGLYSSSHLLS